VYFSLEKADENPARKIHRKAGSAKPPTMNASISCAARYVAVSSTSVISDKYSNTKRRCRIRSRIRCNSLMQSGAYCIRIRR
jgi:hypothetical protein